MPEKKKRERVVAEISVTHLRQLALDMGQQLSEADALAFLNQQGHAYDMWKEMMRAGENYLRACIAVHPPSPSSQPDARASSKAAPLSVQQNRHPDSARVVAARAH